MQNLQKLAFSTKFNLKSLEISQFFTTQDTAKYGSVKGTKHLLSILGEDTHWNTSYWPSIRNAFVAAVTWNHCKIVSLMLRHCAPHKPSTNSFRALSSRKNGKMRPKSKSVNLSRHYHSPKALSLALSAEEVDNEGFSNILHHGITSKSSLFYDETTSNLLDIVVENGNLKMFEILVEHDSWPLITAKMNGNEGIAGFHDVESQQFECSEALCRLVSDHGFEHWIEFAVEQQPEILRVPFLVNESLKSGHLEYVDLILERWGHRMDITPTLLFVLLNRMVIGNMDFAAEIMEKLLDSAGVRDLEWRPSGSLREQWYVMICW